MRDVGGAGGFGGATPTSRVMWLDARGRAVPCVVTDYRRAGSPKAQVLVIVPAYRAEAWLADCLRALEENDIAHDVLVIDDGSPVPVANFIEPKPNLIIARMLTNAGLVGVLNWAALFACAQGYAYYARQDADDLPRPHRLDIQYALALRSGADLVISPARMIDKDGAEIWSPPRRRRAVKDARRRLHIRNFATHSSWFLRTDVFSRVGLYDPRCVAAEDYDLLIRLARVGSIVETEEVLIDYRVHGGSITATSMVSRLTTLRLQLKFFDFALAESYLGLVRTLAALFVSRRLKIEVRRRAGAQRLSTHVQGA